MSIRSVITVLISAVDGDHDSRRMCGKMIKAHIDAIVEYAPLPQSAIAVAIKEEEFGAQSESVRAEQEE